MEEKIRKGAKSGKITPSRFLMTTTTSREGLRSIDFRTDGAAISSAVPNTWATTATDRRSNSQHQLPDDADNRCPCCTGSQVEN